MLVCSSPGVKTTTPGLDLALSLLSLVGIVTLKLLCTVVLSSQICLPEFLWAVFLFSPFTFLSVLDVKPW